MSTPTDVAAAGTADDTPEADPRKDTVQRLEAIGAAAVIRMEDPEKLVRVAEAIARGGIPAIEVTMTVPGALEMIERADRQLGDDILLGVGSVTDAETTHWAVEAGARYVVSPIFKPEIVQAAHAGDAAALPGAFTPTEIQHAYEAGADFVKVFPASILGMKFVRAVRAPLPHLKLVPTGGVTLTDAGDWLRAGASAVGVGSALLDRDAIAAGNYAQLVENARVLRRSLDEAREGHAG